MKSRFFFGLILLLGYYSNAQYKVSFVLDQLPAPHVGETIFIAGNFNSWNPGNENYRSVSSDNKNIINLVLSAGTYEYKFTRGGWDKGEAGQGGAGVGNRVLKLSGDTVIRISIAEWSDNFVHPERVHTVSANVSVMDTAFFIPQLNRSRRIWIYLPKEYAGSSKHYPVLYMHDGQNLFDDLTSGFGEWGIDECLDSLIAKGCRASIVIGIDNGPRRFNEYNPYDFEKFGAGEGKAYTDFIVQTLKPFIDQHYRTMPSKENTLIAGSSMGGLISYYAMLKYPEVFGKAGIFSPAFWTAPAIKNLTDSLAAGQKGKLFFYMGGQEGESYIHDMQDVQEKMGKLSSAAIYAVIDDEGSHNERAWRKWFPEFYQWIMAEGYSYFIPEGH
ncbi:MAG: alpha/beta hydrolase-fold protein [Ferruginibacter sp.]